jgi:hypothetical protein
MYSIADFSEKVKYFSDIFLSIFTTKLEPFSKKIFELLYAPASAPVCNWLQNPQNFPSFFSKVRPPAKKKRSGKF